MSVIVRYYHISLKLIFLKKEELLQTYYNELPVIH